MEELSDLINIVNRKRLSKIDILDKTFLKSKSTNLYYRLYSAIEKKHVKNDEEAGKLIYGTGKDDPRYRMLKSRLKEKVLKSILLLDINETFNNESGRAYYECITQSQRIEILIQLCGTNTLVYELVKESYSKALKYNFYDILKNYSFYLLTYYGLKGDKKSFSDEEPKYFQYFEFTQKTQYAKFLYYKVCADFVRPIPITNDLLIDVKKI